MIKIKNLFKTNKKYILLTEYNLLNNKYYNYEYNYVWVKKNSYFFRKQYKKFIKNKE
jgi:hypothetical protein